MIRTQGWYVGLKNRRFEGLCDKHIEIGRIIFSLIYRACRWSVWYACRNWTNLLWIRKEGPYDIHVEIGPIILVQSTVDAEGRPVWYACRNWTENSCPIHYECGWKTHVVCVSKLDREFLSNPLRMRKEDPCDIHVEIEPRILVQSTVDAKGRSVWCACRNWTDNSLDAKERLVRYAYRNWTYNSCPIYRACRRPI